MLLQGDARRIPLADETVQTCVTSPPYWGLRDYGLGDGGIGLEKTPEEYVQNIVQVFREVKRVLRDDGTLWMNLGDCYARTGGWASNDGLDGCKRGESGRAKTNMQAGRNGQKRPDNLKEKDLVGIPWRVAFALQADGWYLRSDIIWAKPNPMPESVTDRPTKSHEYMFLLAKQPRYYYDAEAVKEDGAVAAGRVAPFSKMADRGGRAGAAGRVPSGNEKPGGTWTYTGTRNRRDVWFIATQPYKGAHFATYPEKLVEPCILAGSSPKACGVCGAPWERVTESTKTSTRPGNTSKYGERDKQSRCSDKSDFHERRITTTETLGWRPTCDHNDDTGRSIVLDPFCGSGTTGAVAKCLGRDFVGLDMNPEYLKLAEVRIGKVTEGMGL